MQQKNRKYLNFLLIALSQKYKLNYYRIDFRRNLIRRIKMPSYFLFYLYSDCKYKTKCKTKMYFLLFSPTKIYCKFTYPINAF